jgi:hypothetical protein
MLPAGVWWFEIDVVASLFMWCGKLILPLLCFKQSYLVAVPSKYLNRLLYSIILFLLCNFLHCFILILLLLVDFYTLLINMIDKYFGWIVVLDLFVIKLIVLDYFLICIKYFTFLVHLTWFVIFKFIIAFSAPHYIHSKQ